MTAWLIGFANSWVATILAGYGYGVWLFILSLAFLVLLLRISRLDRRFASEFKDDFTGDLREKWDFVAPWRLAQRGILEVVGGQTVVEEAGGISKSGSQWENYVFTFEAKVIRECLGVIVRARDLNNYYMFQIRADRIRPHRRIEFPMVHTMPQPPGAGGPVLQPVSIGVGWNDHYNPAAISGQLTDWFKVKVVVEGETVRIYVNEDLILHEDSFLHIPTGKIGFRNYGTELAYVKNVRVTLLQ